MTIVEETLFHLLRAAFGTEELQKNIRLRPQQWKKLADMATCQQVSAIAFDSLCQGDNNIPEDIKAAWSSYCNFLAAKFDAQLTALNHLTAVLEAENIKVLTLKGMGLALCYPKPQLRESVDIDVFCFDDYDKVNRFVVSCGLCQTTNWSEGKHVVFDVDGIEVENHRKFTSNRTPGALYAGNLLMNMSKEDPRRDGRMEGILFPSVQMGALHLFFHTVMHLAYSGITLRHLCDITAYLRHLGDKIDMHDLHSALKTAGMEKISTLILTLCNKWLGLGFDLSGWESFNIGEKALKDEKRLLHSIFHPFKDSSEVPDPLRKILRKIPMTAHRNRYYPMVYGEKNPETYLDTFVCLQNVRRRIKK